MRLTKVAERDGPVYGSEYFRQQNLVWVARQGVAAANSAFGVHQTRTFERQQNLFEIRLGQGRSSGNVTHRNWSGLVGVQGQRQQGATRIIAPS